MSQTTNTESPASLFREAPLVHLISIELGTLTPEQLDQHLAKIREIRSSPQTARAQTEQRVRKTANKSFDLGML